MSVPRTSQRRTEHREPSTKKPTTGTGANSVEASETKTVLIEKPQSPGKPNSRATATGSVLESGAREKLVREGAYFRAERRGFSPGGELEDWVAAERDVDQMLMDGKDPTLALVGQSPA
jgi:Protein of unknown function (DUF2934)